MFTNLGGVLGGGKPQGSQQTAPTGRRNVLEGGSDHSSSSHSDSKGGDDYRNWEGESRASGASLSKDIAQWGKYVGENSEFGDSYASDSLASDIEVLRGKNLALRAELDRYKSPDLGGEVKRLEFTWFHLPAVRWSFLWFLTHRGMEHSMLYLWILRLEMSTGPVGNGEPDWGKQDYQAANVIGGFAAALSIVCLLRAIFCKNVGETWHSFCRFLWQLGTFLWCHGSVHDNYLPDETPISDTYRIYCGQLLTASLILHGIYIVLLRPRFQQSFHKVVTPYDEPRLKFVTWHFRCPSFIAACTWRDFENAQLFFWVGKDLAAAYGIEAMFLIFYAPLIALTLLLINTSLNTRRVVIDNSHYLAICFWQVGNLICQMGAVFFIGYDNAWEYMYPRHQSARFMCEWYGKFVIIFGFFPIIALHVWWALLTILGYFREEEIVVTQQLPTRDDELVPMPLEESWLDINRGDKFMPV